MSNWFFFPSYCQYFPFTPIFLLFPRVPSPVCHPRRKIPFFILSPPPSLANLAWKLCTIGKAASRGGATSVIGNGLEADKWARYGAPLISSRARRWPSRGYDEPSRIKVRLDERLPSCPCSIIPILHASMEALRLEPCITL